MNGIEFLRNIYTSSGLSIKPKNIISKVEMLKTFARGIGLDPKRILTKKALVEPHRTYASKNDREDYEIKLISRELKEALKKEIVSEFH